MRVLAGVAAAAAISQPAKAAFTHLRTADASTSLATLTAAVDDSSTVGTATTHKHLLASAERCLMQLNDALQHNGAKANYANAAAMLVHAQKIGAYCATAAAGGTASDWATTDGSKAHLPATTNKCFMTNIAYKETTAAATNSVAPRMTLADYKLFFGAGGSDSFALDVDPQTDGTVVTATASPLLTTQALDAAWIPGTDASTPVVQYGAAASQAIIPAGGSNDVFLVQDGTAKAAKNCDAAKAKDVRSTFGAACQTLFHQIYWTAAADVTPVVGTAGAQLKLEQYANKMVGGLHVGLLSTALHQKVYSKGWAYGDQVMSNYKPKAVAAGASLADGESACKATALADGNGVGVVNSKCEDALLTILAENGAKVNPWLKTTTAITADMPWDGCSNTKATYGCAKDSILGGLTTTAADTSLIWEKLAIIDETAVLTKTASTYNVDPKFGLPKEGEHAAFGNTVFELTPRVVDTSDWSTGECDTLEYATGGWTAAGATAATHNRKANPRFVIKVLVTPTSAATQNVAVGDVITGYTKADGTAFTNYASTHAAGVGGFGKAATTNAQAQAALRADCKTGAKLTLGNHKHLSYTKKSGTCSADMRKALKFIMMEECQVGHALVDPRTAGSFRGAWEAGLGLRTKVANTAAGAITLPLKAGGILPQALKDCGWAAPAATCAVGKGGAQASACTHCAKGKYSAVTTLTACSDCGAGKYSDETGNSASAHCKTCPKGKWSANAASSCSLCAAGTYGDATGLSAAAACKNCTSGSTTAGAIASANCSSTDADATTKASGALSRFSALALTSLLALIAM